MTAFVALLGCVTIAVLAAVLWPLVRGGGAAADELPPDAQHRAVYRDQLAELDRDVARGMIAEPEAAVARIEIQRRLLRGAAADAAPVATGRNPALALVLAVMVLAGAGGFYFLNGAPFMATLPAGGPATARTPPAGDDAALIQAVAELERRLAGEPANGEGWLLLARSRAALGRWSAAVEAYGRALALLPPNPELLAAQAEAMVLAAGGIVTEAAREGFARVLAQEPDSQVARFYLAAAEAQAGRSAAAIQAWLALAAELPAESPLRADIVRRATTAAREAGLPPPELPPPAAAPDPAAQQAMIRGMVERLAARLAEQPDDVDGWIRLGRSYAVLGEAAKSAEAYARAAALRPSDPAIPLAEAQALLEGLPIEAPFPPRALDLLRRVLAADPNQPSALWHLGVEAAKRGAHQEAAGYWERLLRLLPGDGDDARMVRAALAAIRRP